MPAVKALIYTRVSRASDSDEDDGTVPSTGRQEQACRQQAEALGWEVVAVETDDGISGFADVERPAFERTREAVTTGLVDVVMVWKLDRLARRVSTVLEFAELLQEHDTHLRTVVDGVDTTGPNGKFILQLMATIAELESDTIALRVKSAFAAQARAGMPHMGASKPFGFADDKITHEPAEAEVIRAAVDGFLDDGVPFARTFREHGFGDLNPTVITRLVRSPRYAGFRLHDGELHRAVWEPIIDLPTWTRLQERLGSGELVTDQDGRMRWIAAPPSHGKASVWRHLLTDLLKCEVCGANMSHSGPKGGTSIKRRERTGITPRYTCPKGRCVGINAEEVEAIVTKEVLDVRAGMIMMKHFGPDDRQTIEEEIAGIEEKLRRLTVAHFVDDKLSEGEFDAAREPLNAALVDARMRLNRSARLDLTWAPGDRMKNLDQWWDAASLEERRKMVGSLIERIDVRRMDDVRAEEKARFERWKTFPDKRAYLTKRRVVIHWREWEE